MSINSLRKLIRLPRISGAIEDERRQEAKDPKVDRSDGVKQQASMRPEERRAMQEAFLIEPSTQSMSRGDGVDAVFRREVRLTDEERARYVRACTMCEFMTSVASAMESSGAQNESLSDRMDDFIEPVRAARDWMRHIGQAMVCSEPLPNRVREALEIAEHCALDALPEFKALIDEACEGLAGGVARLKPSRDGARLKIVA
jgi:hypothetical protein